MVGYRGSRAKEDLVDRLGVGSSPRSVSPRLFSVVISLGEPGNDVCHY